MEDKLRGEVRKVLSEEMGVQKDIKEISRSISDDIINQIRMNKEKINDGRLYSLATNIIPSDSQKKNINIDNIFINITYQKTGENKVGGSYKSDKLTLQDDGSYLVYIELNIKPNVIDNLFQIKINSVISHELNHAFVDIKSASGKNKLLKLNRANKMISKFSHFSGLSKYPEIREFNEMLYLSSPAEIQARIQETGVQVDSADSKSSEEIVKYLLRFQPLNDARKMIAYKKDEIIKLEPKIIKEYIDLFNKNLNNSFGENSVKIINDVDGFFEHWVDVINDAGKKMLLKIYKLVANKKNIQESFLIFNTSDVFDWVFGENF